MIAAWKFSEFAYSTQDLSQRQDQGHMEILLSIRRCSIWHNLDGTHTHTRHKGEQLLCPLVFAMDHNNCKICAGVPLAFDELGQESVRAECNIFGLSLLLNIMHILNLYYLFS